MILHMRMIRIKVHTYVCITLHDFCNLLNFRHIHVTCLYGFIKALPMNNYFKPLFNEKIQIKFLVYQL